MRLMSPKAWAARPRSVVLRLYTAKYASLTPQTLTTEQPEWQLRGVYEYACPRCDAERRRERRLWLCPLACPLARARAVIDDHSCNPRGCKARDAVDDENLWFV